MNNNYIILQSCMEDYKKKNQLEFKDSTIYELFTITQITKHLNISFENIQNSLVDGGNEGGIDSIIITINDEIIESEDDLETIDISKNTKTKFIITQCKNERSFKELTISKLIVSAPIIFDLGNHEDFLLKHFNPKLVEKILLIRQCWIKSSQHRGDTEIIYNYCCNAEKIEINSTFQSKIDQLKQTTIASCQNTKVTYNNFSNFEIFNLYKTQKLTSADIVFKEQPLSICYKDSDLGYIGIVKLDNYKNILLDEDGYIKDHLFESNIRHFQNAVDVNKKIASTIRDEQDIDFWWLNNGITIIADNPRLTGKTLYVDNIQIVNGLQTSYTIFNEYKTNSEDERSVLLKVIITKDTETIDNIIASTNRQNQVSPTMLRATDEIQKNIELFFHSKGFFYDRRKNYYKNIGKPASKIFSIQLTAQAIETILFHSPHTARAKPTSLLKEEKTYIKLFDKDKNYQTYLNCCLIVSKTFEYWSNLENITIKSNTSNLKLHISRIVASLLTEKATFSFEKVLELDIKQYTEKIFNRAIDILSTTVEKVQKTDPESNLINLAKNKKLSTEIDIELEIALEL